MHSSRIGLKALDAVLVPLRKLRLAPLRLSGGDRDPDRELPLLLVANHVSWWDGFLIRQVHERLRPDGPFCIVMTDRELSRRPWLRALGAVGLQQGSVASIRGTLRELARRRREAPRTVFVFFPQGAIWPATRRPLGFRTGIELVARTLAPVVVLPTAIHIEPLNGPVPVPFISLSRPRTIDRADSVDAAALESAVERELDAVLAFLGRHGENAPDAWPAFDGSEAQSLEHR
jgi:1-acyl-sn-glycerol-3-phosphate acyltransferase